MSLLFISSLRGLEDAFTDTVMMTSGPSLVENISRPATQDNCLWIEYSCQILKLFNEN